MVEHSKGGVGMRRATTGLFVGLILVSSRAQAGLVYSSPPDYSQRAFLSTSSPGEQESTPFMVAASTTITRVDWWGDYSDAVPGADDFRLGLYAGDGGPAPSPLSLAVPLTLTRTDTGSVNSLGREVYRYSATLASPFRVAGSTPYDIAILNSLTTWRWQFGAAGTNYYRQGGDGTPWITSGSPYQDAVQLFDTPAAAVPEPSSLALGTAAALTSLLARLRPRSRRA